MSSGVAPQHPFDRLRASWNERWLAFRLRHGLAQRGRTGGGRPGAAMAVPSKQRVRMSYRVIRKDGTVEDEVVFKDSIEELPPAVIEALDRAARKG